MAATSIADKLAKLEKKITKREKTIADAPESPLLQTKLTESGYYAYDIDGKFGKLTLGGVLAYQLENSLEVDGVCGAKTRASLMSR